MKIMKFGSKSLATPERLKQVAGIILAEPMQKIVVFSAISGTGRALNSICDLLAQNQKVEARIKIDELFIKYRNFISGLLEQDSHIESAMSVLEEQFGFLNFILKISYSDALKSDILSQGELLSTRIFSIYLAEQNVKHAVLPALDFMQLDANGEALIGPIKIKLSQILQRTPNTILLTQGYLVRNVKGDVASLGQGGGDYSAALIASALNAEVCEIWTDVADMIDSNLNIFRDSKIDNILSFEEAAELAYYGGKLLLPSSIGPANYSGIPVTLKDLSNPQAKGTTITTSSHYNGVAAIATRNHFVTFQIRNNKIYLRDGFLSQVLAVFAKFDTAIEMITTSEVGVAVSITNKEHLNSIVTELSTIGSVELNEFQSMICLVGNVITRTNQVIKKIFDALDGIPLSMISFGASPHSISFIVSEMDRDEAVQKLKATIFRDEEIIEKVENGILLRSEELVSSQTGISNGNSSYSVMPKMPENPINTELRKEKIYGDNIFNRSEIEKNKIDFEKFFRDHSM